MSTTETEAGVEIEISAVWSGRELVARAAKTGRRFAIVAAGTGSVLMFVYAMRFARNRSVAWVWNVFLNVLQQATPMVGLTVVAPIVAAGLVGAVVSIWRNRSLAESYRLQFDGRDLKCTKRTILGDRNVFFVLADDILEVQQGPVDRGSRQHFRFATPYEITVVTDENIHTFGSGLRKGNCVRVTETLERMAGASNDGRIPWRQEAGHEPRTPSLKEGLDGEDVDIDSGKQTSGSLRGFWRRYRLTLGGSAILGGASAIGLLALSGVLMPSNGASAILDGLFYEYFPFLCFLLLAILAVSIPVVRFFEYRRLFDAGESRTEASNERNGDTRRDVDEVVFEFDETDQTVESTQKEEGIE